MRAARCAIDSPAVSAGDVALLIGGGLLAGVINTLAGGGSLLSVPLLVLLGLPGTLANGTNRIGIVTQSLAASWRFRSEGVSGLRPAIPVLIPLAAGAGLGALAISHASDVLFERLFGALMLLLLVPTLWPRRPRGEARAWSPPVSAAVFFGIGVYAGAIQAGVGLALVIALHHAGFDLVRANAIKMVVVSAVTLVALPIFAWQGQIAWLPGLVLAVGFGAGGVLGARLAVRGGERLIRPVLALAVVVLAGRMLGLY